MSQQHKVSGRATTVARGPLAGEIRVTYHNTTVVQVSANGRVTLNHNGWRTATTKTRMNQASNQFNLGYSVWQKKGEWFVDYDGRTIPFDKTPLVLRKTRKSAPPCAASMGCLCAGHARGAPASAACDTSEE